MNHTERENVLTAATVNANATYGPFNNYAKDSESGSFEVDLSAGAPSGTSPTLTLTVSAVDDAGNVYHARQEG
jgi:hypothetical protein